jgi:hypothetical protein
LRFMIRFDDPVFSPARIASGQRTFRSDPG